MMPAQKRFRTKYAGVYYIEGKAVGSNKKEKIFYMMYRKDGKQVHEKAGRQYEDDMTPARAAGIRVHRLSGKEPTNKERRQAERATKKNAEGKGTMDPLSNSSTETKSDNGTQSVGELQHGKYDRADFDSKEPKVLFPDDTDGQRIESLKMPSPLSVHRETYVDKIIEVIEERILSGKLIPKSKISEAQLGREFGVSRAPAREALARLEGMGLVEKAYQGRKVKAFNLEEYREIYELRIIVEAYCAKKSSSIATKEDHENLQSIRDEMESNLISGNMNNLRALQAKFHDYIIRYSKNQTLINVYQLQAKKVRWATKFLLDLPNHPKQDFKEHCEILNAFISRDGEKVRTLMEKHTARIMEIVLKHFEQISSASRREKTGIKAD